MKAQLLNYEIDHAESLGRKDGVLYIRKGFHRNRDLLMSFIESLDRTVVLITAGRSLSSVEQMNHNNLRNVVRINGNEPSDFLSLSDEMGVFKYVAPSVEKAILLAEDLAQRGDVVLFSPYGTKDEMKDWFTLFDKKIVKIGL